MTRAGLLSELGEALHLAAEAQRCHWSLYHRYTAELEELARIRRDLAPLVNGSRHGRRARWELAASDDGKTFDLAITVPRRLGGGRLLRARGDRGTVAWAS